MIEEVILGGLVFKEQYARAVLPFLKKEYFYDESYKLSYTLIEDYIQKYNKPPTREVLLTELSERKGVGQETFTETFEFIKNLSHENNDHQWMLDTTEKFCKDKALFNAIKKSVEIYDNKDGKLLPTSIPGVLQDALAVSFDNAIGHDFLKDAEERYKSYREKIDKLPFRVPLLNRITDDGIETGTLNVLLAPTHVGKSLALCSFAADNLLDGKNVLYISLEMSEKSVAQRIDANLLDIPIGELKTFPHDLYQRKIARLRGLTPGNLIVKQFPTAAANVNHFRHLINELRLKKNFFPDVVYVDYLNLMTSSRVKPGQGANSYTIVKSISEELRGLAIEFKLPIWSATQTTRSGAQDSDIDMTATSESWGLPQTCDLMWAMLSNDEMRERGIIMFKNLKNRYKDIGFMPKWVMGIDRPKMRLYEVDENDPAVMIPDKEDKTDDGDQPFFDKTTFGKADTDRKKKYGGFI
jgi:replicative DNA helicase